MTWAHYANFRSLCGMESFIYMFHIYISVGYILSVLFLNYTAALNSSSGSSPAPPPPQSLMFILPLCRRTFAHPYPKG